MWEVRCWAGRRRGQGVKWCGVRVAGGVGGGSREGNNKVRVGGGVGGRTTRWKAEKKRMVQKRGARGVQGHTGVGRLTRGSREKKLMKF